MIRSVREGSLWAPVPQHLRRRKRNRDGKVQFEGEHLMSERV
jgi:hypothetical protein